MNEADDPLEAELAALRPHEVSPGLQRRVAERLAQAPPSRARWLWGSALAGGLAAACLVAAILLGRGTGPVVPTRRTTVEVPPAPRGASDDSLPTLQVYQRALAWSPEALDALLDKHAVRASSPEPREARLCAFLQSDAAIHALLGEP